MRQAEGIGRTVDEAVDRALDALGASREGVEIEILDPGARGMLGLGAREARVRVALKAGAGDVVRHVTSRVLRLMGFDGTVHVREQAGVLSVEIEGEHLGALIGRRGSTLDALELLVGLIVTKDTKARTKVVVDVAGYRERRTLALEDLARRMAERAAGEGREVLLDPMDAAERRIIHTTLADHARVYTYSRGEGAARRVVIAPKPAGPRAPHTDVLDA